jgi:4a-hydroxytetrahydrobiopterin dehydratase
MTLLSPEALSSALAELPAWSLEAEGTVLARTFRFPDFPSALAAMTRVAFEAEALGHHPDWANSYNRLEVRLTTHDAGGLTEKDLTLARAFDRLCAP